MWSESVTVVIPTCDRQEYLTIALESVLAQSSPAQEILIIDNGNSPVDIKKLPRSELVKVIRALPRFGVSQARNFGAIIAQCDLICFLDDDDSWDRDYLRYVRESRENSGAGIILGRLRDFHSKKPLFNKQAIDFTQAELIDQILFRNPGTVGSNICVTRQCFNVCSGFDPFLTTGEDKAFVLELILVGFDVSYTVKGWVNFRNDGFGPRQTDLSTLRKGKIRFLIKYWKIMPWKCRLINLAIYARLALRKGTSGSG